MPASSLWVAFFCNPAANARGQAPLLQFPFLYPLSHA